MRRKNYIGNVDFEKNYLFSFPNEKYKWPVSKPSSQLLIRLMYRLTAFPSLVGGESNSIWQNLIPVADIFINLTDKKTISQQKFLRARDFIFTASPNKVNSLCETCRFNCLDNSSVSYTFFLWLKG